MNSVDLITMDVDLSVIDIFDPLRQTNQQQSTKIELPANTSSLVTPSKVSLLFPYPIKLNINLAAYHEMKPFSQLVQQIRHEQQLQQVDRLWRIDSRTYLIRTVAEQISK
jgi:hypothetical protein